MLEGLGVETGIQLDALVDAASYIDNYLGNNKISTDSYDLRLINICIW